MPISLTQWKLWAPKLLPSPIDFYLFFLFLFFFKYLFFSASGSNNHWSTNVSQSDLGRTNKHAFCDWRTGQSWSVWRGTGLPFRNAIWNKLRTIENSIICLVLINYSSPEVLEFLVKYAEKNEKDKWILDLATLHDVHSFRIMKRGLHLFVDFFWKASGKTLRSDKPTRWSRNKHVCGKNKWTDW